MNIFGWKYLLLEAFHYEVTVVAPQIIENYRHYIAAETPFLVCTAGLTSAFQLQITLAVCGASVIKRPVMWQ